MAASIIGVAGYMGSGKTTAARYLAGSGVYIDADALAKQVINRDQELKRRLSAAFGGGVVSGENVDSAALGRIVFADQEALRTLNTIVHPAVIAEIEKRVKAVLDGACVVDAALIPLWNIPTWFTTLLWIEAGPETRFMRLKAKLSLSERDIRRRMQLQEAFFTPPHSANWRSIANEQSLKGLYAALDTIKTDVNIA